MNYSNYSLDQILEYSDYGKICECFFRLAKDEETIKKLESILYSGGLDGHSIHSKLHVKDNPRLESIRRASMAYLLINNPDTFNILMNNDINIFHGTNANALPSILRYGLNSANKSQESGIDVTTGEAWSRRGGRDFISFTDIFEIAEDYSFLKPEKGSKELDFSVIIGTTSDDISQTRAMPIRSDISEIGVIGTFPKERIKCICVPDDKVDFVRRIVNNSQIMVLGLSRMEDKFFYVHDFSSLGFDPNAFDRYVKNERTKKSHFSNEEIKDVSKKRKMSKMSMLVEKLKSVFSKEEETYGRRI